MKKRPEREIIERAYQQNARRKAHEIAKETGLMDSLGYDKAVEYVRRVKRDMKKAGQIVAAEYATDAERLSDIAKLFELRQGKMSKAAAYKLLLLNCYYRLRSEDDEIHMAAIDDTYAKNTDLQEPFTMAEAIHICDIALAQYMNSIDEAKNEAAVKRGFPGAGLNYSDDSLIMVLEITDAELEHMESIRKGQPQE